MLNLQEYRKSADRLSDLLPWAALVAPGIVLNKDGSLQSSLSFRGPDLASSTQTQLVAATARLNNALKRLGSGWAIFIEARRKKALDYPEAGSFPDPLSTLIDQERRAHFESDNEHYESVYYLTFLYLPPQERTSKISNLFIRSSDSQHEANHRRTLAFFTTHVHRLFDILKDFMFETTRLNDQETLTYLHSTISHRYHPVRVPDVPAYLDSLLCDSPLFGGLEPKLGDYYLKTLSIVGFPTTSMPAILDQLNDLPMEYRWVTRFLPLDKLDAEKEIKNYRRKWFAKRKGFLALLSETLSKSESPLTDSGAMRKSQDADEALLELADDYVSFGYYTATLTVWDRDLTQAKEKLREAERIINGLGFVTINESLNAVEAWLSSLPGQVYANVRMPFIHSLNLAHLLPFSALWAGPEWNAHLQAPVLMLAKTAGNTPFRFSNHIDDVGHQMVIGPSGSGKSVFLSLLALQFLRYQQAQVFIFDKGGSFLGITLGAGGIYYPIGSNTHDSLHFQPLSHIDQMEERIWASEWVLALLENENIETSAQTKDHIWDALCNLSHTPPAQRTLTGLSALLQDQTLRLALQPYCLGGPYGSILDADHNNIKTGHFQCFEMHELLQTPEIVGPILSYLFYILEKRFQGQPTLLILDEASLLLEHTLFSSKIKEWLKTLRKRNVSVIFATQSVDDALHSKIAASLLEACPSRIFLPNDRALEPNIQEKYMQLGLNEKQIHLIAHAQAKRHYYFESHRGHALFDLNLSALALHFCGLSRPEAKQILLQHYEEYGPHAFLAPYLIQAGFPWAAEYIQTSVMQADNTREGEKNV